VNMECSVPDPHPDPIRMFMGLPAPSGSVVTSTDSDLASDPDDRILSFQTYFCYNFEAFKFLLLKHKKYEKIDFFES
jgi:hypothetical protein